MNLNHPVYFGIPSPKLPPHFPFFLNCFPYFCSSGVHQSQTILQLANRLLAPFPSFLPFSTHCTDYLLPNKAECILGQIHGIPFFFFPSCVADIGMHLAVSFLLCLGKRLLPPSSDLLFPPFLPFSCFPKFSTILPIKTLRNASTLFSTFFGIFISFPCLFFLHEACYHARHSLHNMSVKKEVLHNLVFLPLHPSSAL